MARLVDQGMRSNRSSDDWDGNEPLPGAGASHRRRHGSQPTRGQPPSDPAHTHPSSDRAGREPYDERYPSPGDRAKWKSYDEHFPLVRDAAPQTSATGSGSRGALRDNRTGLTDDKQDYRRRQSVGLNFLVSLARSQAATGGFPAIMPIAETRQQRMLEQPQAEFVPSGSRVLGLLRDPALRSAVALALSAILSGALGLVFWARTAHYQSTATVGHVSAEVSAISFLAVIGGLNLAVAFVRFLPLAGWSTRRMLLASYTASASVGLLASAIFMLTPLSKALILDGTAGRFAFTLCVVINSVFMFQDGGLVAFGKATWVPVENLLVAIARLGLIAIIAKSVSLSATAGILWSWAVPMGLSVLVVTTLSLGPLAGRQSRMRPELPANRELMRWVSIEAATTIVGSSVIAFLPALVTWRLGDIQGAYFFVPWTIATMGSLLLTNVFISMVREVITAPKTAAVTINRSIRLAGAVAIAGVLGCTVLGKLVLLPLGSGYAIYGSSFLRWIGFSFPATAIIMLYFAVCLVKIRPGMIFAANCAMTIGTIGGLMTLGHGTSIAMVGAIYCSVQWVVAAACAIPAVRGIRAIMDETKARRRRHG
jgi:O-antigen/teichoic acid export membrane protein